MAWIQWRLEQANPQARLRGKIALFWNPTARNTAKRWTPDALERQWNAACESVGVRVSSEQRGRRKGSLVEVDCAAFPDTLLESELFGHEKASSPPLRLAGGGMVTAFNHAKRRTVAAGGF